MARGVEFRFTLNPREFLRGLKLIEDDLEDLQSEGDTLERSLEDNFRDIADAAERAGRDANEGLSKGLSDQGGQGAAAAGGVLAGEVFDEFIESWGEAVRSGEYGEAIRETFSNLGQIGGAAFGPVGAAGGAVAGLFLTGIYDKITDTAEKERIAEATASAFDAIDADTQYERGRQAYLQLVQGYVDEAGAGERLAEALGVESAAEAFLRIREEAEKTGLPIETVRDAYLGLPGALREVEGALAANTEEADRVAAAAGRTSDSAITNLTAYEDMIAPLDEAKGLLETMANDGERQADAAWRAYEAEKARAEVLGQTDQWSTPAGRPWVLPSGGLIP